MNSLQRANALFEKGQKTFERAYSKETLNLNEVDKAIKLFKESLIIYEAVYGEDFASRAHVEINTILLVLINRASANDDNSSLSDINRCSELLRKALLTALPELVEHYYDASLEMLDFYRKSKNSVFYT